MLTIIVPVYNEAGAIEEFHRKLNVALAHCTEPWEVLYVNDGSTDNSGAILRELTGACVIEHETNRGYGASLKTGILNSTSELIAITDCDGTYDSLDLLKLLDKMKTHEMAVGARPPEKGIRLISKSILRSVASYAVDYRIPDLNSGLRIFTRDLVMRVIHLLPNGFSFTSTITLGALYLPRSVSFVPISYGKRTGKSKIRPLHAFSNFLLLITRIMVLFNPLRFFLPAALLFGLAGAGFLVRDIIAANVAQTSILMLTNSFILFAIGLLAEAVRWKK